MVCKFNSLLMMLKLNLPMNIYLPKSQMNTINNGIISISLIPTPKRKLYQELDTIPTAVLLPKNSTLNIIPHLK